MIFLENKRDLTTFTTFNSFAETRRREQGFTTFMTVLAGFSTVLRLKLLLNLRYEQA